jgi:hypothetical protein
MRNVPPSQFKHGLSRTTEYKAWGGMMHRCKPTYWCRKDYFDRGISVCDEWKDKNTGFKAFYTYLETVIGLCPGKGFSLDRINNNLGYTPGNLRWATKSEQCRNRRKFSSIEKFSDAVIAAEYEKRSLVKTNVLTEHPGFVRLYIDERLGHRPKEFRI